MAVPSPLMAVWSLARKVECADVYPIQKQHLKVNIQVQRTAETPDQGHSVLVDRVYHLLLKNLMIQLLHAWPAISSSISATPSC